MKRQIFTEKMEGFDTEALRLKNELTGFFGDFRAHGTGMEPESIKKIRIIRRYEVYGLDEKQFDQALAILTNPKTEKVFTVNPLEQAGTGSGHEGQFFGIEYLPGQYDQRTDSLEQCVEITAGTRPKIKITGFYQFESAGRPFSAKTLEKIKNYLINPLDSRETSADLENQKNDDALYPAENEPPSEISVIKGFINKSSADPIGLAMSADDLEFCRSYFAGEGRDPTFTELRLLDTYWSDHCRHTTFNTVLEKIDLDDSDGANDLAGALKLYREARKEVYGAKADKRPETLMDMATIGAKVLKKRGLVKDIDESAEVNACTVRIEAEFAANNPEGQKNDKENWLLLFKNETHNHPTEIEPYGGASTCLGGAIRDPLAGRAYVHQAMRVTGGGDPRTDAAGTINGKLPQIKLARVTASGYSAYGNQIGIPAGQVSEIYHPGFLAKRLEMGAVIGAVPEEWVRREEPAPGDMVILVGSKTGRDGIGGATGSSKTGSGERREIFGAEVPKGSAPEERKILRLFRKKEVCKMIKRCNDFGAGGVSVAVGEIAAGLDINLDAVPAMYGGLDGTDLAISESQERMAVVIAAKDTEAFIKEAAAENLEASIIAKVTAGPEDSSARLCMKWREKTIADLSREFLNSGGSVHRAQALLHSLELNNESDTEENLPPGVLLDNLERELASLRSGSRRGLGEYFDGSAGSGSVLFPWGGKEQGTPECGMAALLPSLEKQSLTSTIMTFGYDPYIMERDPYRGAKGSVLEALAKYACLGGNYQKARLSFQEYFESTRTKETWGKPAAALLGALEAQLNLGIPAIGGKDSMSGNFRYANTEITVPPTLAAFAAGTAPANKIRSGALSGNPGNTIILLCQNINNPAVKHQNEWDRFRANMKILEDLTDMNLVCSAWPVGPGGIAAALAIMAFGNMTGIEAYAHVLSLTDDFDYQGSVLAEIKGEAPVLPGCDPLVIAARTMEKPIFRIACEDETMTADIPLDVLRRAYEYPLSGIYPQTSAGSTAAEPCGSSEVPSFIRTVPVQKTKPRNIYGSAPLVLIPVFPGTNTEWDLEKAFREAGAKTRFMIFENKNQNEIRISLERLEKEIMQAQILVLQGGFGAGDEPDGSGKFIAQVLLAPLITGALTKFLDERDGLILGIQNGFQALLRTGLLPHGLFRESGPFLAQNKLGRHVSRMVRTKQMSSLSPWLALEEPGTIHVIPVSCGEGRLVAERQEAEALFNAGQVPFCYADSEGNPAFFEPDNPCASDYGIESLCSPDGRILGKIGHCERAGEFVHVNIPGNKKQRIFEAGVKYFG